MNKSESKYFNTAIKMDKAFLELLNQKDFEFITIKEICALAGVNRSTFYLHYETVNDLLLETSNYINQKFKTYFSNKQFDIKNVSVLDAEDLCFIKPEYLIPWLNFIKDNKRLFTTVLNHYNTLQMDKNFAFLLNQIATPALLKHGTKPEDINYKFLFYLEGIMAVVKEWLKHGCSKPLDQIVDIIIECIKIC